MKYLIYGENNFLAREKFDSLVEDYRKKGFEIKTAFAGDAGAIDSLLAASASIGMFVNNAVIVVKGFEEANKEDSEKMLAEIENVAEIIIWNKGGVDKRSKLFKKFKADYEALEFMPLKSYELEKWVKMYCGQKQFALRQDLIAELVTRVGTNQEILCSEIEKLQLLSESGVKIDKEVVREVVANVSEADIWELIDSLTSKDKGKSLRMVRRMLKEVEYELIVGMIVRQLRLFFLALEFKSPQALISSGVHPFVANKVVRQVSGMSLNRLKSLYNKLVDMEIAVKSGKFEKDLALDLILIAF